METQQHLNIFENGLDERSKAYLLETTRWTKFLAIMGFIGISFLLLFAILTLIGDGYTTGLFYAWGKMGAFIYFLILTAIYFYPTFCLMKFSSLIKSGINNNNVENITEGFRYQKNMFKYIGILSIIGIAIILLAIIFGGVFAAMYRP